MNSIAKWMIAGAVTALVVMTIVMSMAVVPTGYVGIKTQFGKVQDDVLQEGMNFKIPLVEDLILMDCRTKKVEVTSGSSSKDMQTVNVTIALNYNVNKSTANKLYKEVGIDYENIIISPAILESIKSVMAQYTAEELITKRAEVSAMVREALSNKILTRGFDVTEFNITNIDFSQAFDTAIEQKAVKQQEVEAAKAELERQKIQNDKEISIAEKDAKVMELQNSQVTDKTIKLKELEIMEKMIEKWNGEYPKTMLGEDTSALFNVGD